MATSLDAPAQHKQPSRKGKRAWRKNVDVTELQSGLQEVRDQIIQGGIIAEKASEELFALDTTGSTDIQKEYRQKHKPLKVDEILAQRSAVPAVDTRKRASRTTDGILEPKSKKQKVSGKELDRLRSIAYGGDSTHKDVVQTDAATMHDPWAVEAVQAPKYDYLDENRPIRAPKTLKHAPVSLAANGKKLPAVRKPEAGKSYNPTAEDWVDLLEREGNKELEAERKRQQEKQEEEEMLQRQLAAEAEKERQEEGNESAWESEWEGFQSEVEEEVLKKKRPERKSQAQRNKIQRRKEAERQAVHEAKIKAREQQLAQVKALQTAAEDNALPKNQALTLAQEDDSSEGEEKLRKKRFGKIRVPDAPLEVVLSDELQDSLRLLKPEGNLLHDRFRSLMVRGKVEPRRKITQPRQPKTTYTEKWSYKDWKLK